MNTAVDDVVGAVLDVVTGVQDLVVDFSSSQTIKPAISHSLIQTKAGFALGCPSRPAVAHQSGTKIYIIPLGGGAETRGLSLEEFKAEVVAIAVGVLSVGGKVGPGLPGGVVSHLGQNFTLEAVPVETGYFKEIRVTGEGEDPLAPMPVAQALRLTGVELRPLALRAPATRQARLRLAQRAARRHRASRTVVRPRLRADTPFRLDAGAPQRGLHDRRWTV